jgi:hypothetical protein
MAKTATNVNRSRLTLAIPAPLRKRIRVAAAAQNLSVSAYLTRVLEDAIPRTRALKTADGKISPETLRRFAAFRAEQAAPFPEDSADLIRESRAERESRL